MNGKYFLYLFAASVLLIGQSCKKSFEDDNVEQNDSDTEQESGVVTKEETVDISNVSESDSDYKFNVSTLNKIIGKTTSVAVEGTGVTSEGSVATISASGDYYVSGTLNDGQLIVDVADGDEGTVKIILSDVDFSCASGPAMYIKNAEKVSVLISDGTDNKFTSTYTGSDSLACIHSKEDLFFSAGELATGQLTVNSAAFEGIKSTDGIIINGGIFNVTSEDNEGIQAKTYLLVRDGSITAAGGNHAIKTTSEKEGKGYVYITGGSFKLTGQKDGIHATGNVQIDGGSFGIAASDDGISSDSHITIGNGTFKTISVADHGFNAAGNITIKDGEYEIIKADKCIAADGNITIDGGSFTLTPYVTVSGSESGSGHGITTKKNDDTGLRTGNVTINGGNINITQSYEGIQGVVITVNGGTIKVVSSDDAFNASDGGSQMGGMGGGFNPWGGGSSSTSSSSSIALIINGGNIYVTSKGDGLDSNGSMSLNGGIVLVSQNSNSNEPLDAGDGYEPQITGGVVIAVGSQGMASAPSVTQTAVFTSLSGSANSVIAVNDESGNNIMAWKVPQAFQIATISAPELKSGTYQILTNATVSGQEYVEGFNFYYPATSATSNSSTSVTLNEGKCTSNGGNSGGNFGPGGRF